MMREYQNYKMPCQIHYRAELDYYAETDKNIGLVQSGSI